MAERNGLTRGDRRRNNRIAVLRQVVTVGRAVLAIDLGEDKQVAVLVDHDGRVLGRRVMRVKVHRLGAVLVWAAVQAARRGFTQVVVGCEPTGHRWRAVMQLADEAGMGFVCVQSLQVHRARESDDYTRDKTDHKDAVLIGRLIVRLDCYLPERADADWARLRHLGQRRERLLTQIGAIRQQITDLLSCCWPTVLGCAGKPLDSSTWLACLAAVTSRDAPRAGWDRDTLVAAAHPQLAGFGARRLAPRRIVEGFVQAITHPGGVSEQRPGAIERVGFLLTDWRNAARALGEVEQRMTGVLDALGLSTLVSSIPGVTVVGAAAILAETGDPSRFACARGLVKHAGLNPAENTSATFQGQSRLSRRGRPRLRLAAWRAVWGALPHNPVLHARFTHLTHREHNRLSTGQAHAACAATLLRWLHAITTSRRPFDINLATGTTRRQRLHTAA
ncbi:IS110 family RNA-guided transposase [Actinoplanes sp. RD1]|uniref:IS110 family transposase n=1 Tax=Actinoplanes sp. RD1 TaxID=3064538 RepID=UPI002740B755|nr:IS110 family transposase [Actinoplanes sp. RD1]